MVNNVGTATFPRTEKKESAILILKGQNGTFVPEPSREKKDCEVVCTRRHLTIA